LDNARFISNGKVNSQINNVAVTKIPRNSSFTTPHNAVSAHKIRGHISTAPFWVITQCVMVITQRSAVLIYFAAEAWNLTASMFSEETNSDPYFKLILTQIFRDLTE